MSQGKRASRPLKERGRPAHGEAETASFLEITAGGTPALLMRQRIDGNVEGEFLAVFRADPFALVAFIVHAKGAA